MKNRFDISISVTRTPAVPEGAEGQRRSGGADAAERTGVDPLRRKLVAALLAGAAAASLGVSRRARGETPPIEVWTAPSCPCCHDWIAHLEANGFEVITHDGGNNEARERLGMPNRYSSCHTGAIGGFAVEGHVPAREIQRLLEERPDAIGLAVPTMPIGSPGMDGPAYRGLSEPYDVLLIERDGTTSVYASYP